MENKPVYPRDRFFRELAENPYDVRALAVRFGGSWAGHYNRNRALETVPGDGFRHLMGLSDALIANLRVRNWRNAK